MGQKGSGSEPPRRDRDRDQDERFDRRVRDIIDQKPDAGTTVAPRAETPPRRS